MPVPTGMLNSQRRVLRPIYYSLIPGYKTKVEFKVARATLGEPMTLAGVSRLGASREFKTLMLWGSLILGVTMLGWMALRLSRQVSTPPVESQTTKNSH